MRAPAPAAGPTWVDTRQVYDALLLRFSQYANGRLVQLRLPEAAPCVWADPIQLREVFANLVSNAVRYLDKEPGYVEISCHHEGAFVRFGVTDNGPGIPAELQARIFEPFFRGPDSGRTEGSGLGLYFVRVVVEQGCGRLWVESAPGQGSRFWFTVPTAPPP
jgi:signal transduction histidine kinase